MTVLPIRVFGDPVLRERATEVRDFDRGLARLVRNMRETMLEAPGVGLAAPQVGVSRRVVVYDSGDGEEGVLINPVVVEREGSEIAEEGCLSLPGVYFEVERAFRVKVLAMDLAGRPGEIEAEGLLARVFQHEIDHLDGVLFIERLTPELRRQAMRELRQKALGLPSVEPAEIHDAAL